MSSSLPIGVLCVDRVKPTCTLTSPANGATVSGTITLQASVADNDQVASVQYQVDGANHAQAVDTTTLGGGAHSFGAYATDRLGNVSPVSSVSATVSNQPPAIPATQGPAGGVNSGDTLTGNPSAYFDYGQYVGWGRTLQFRFYANFDNPEGKGLLLYGYFDDGASFSFNPNADAPPNGDQTTDWYGPWTNIPGSASSPQLRARLDLMREYGGGSQTNIHNSRIEYQWV